MAGVGLSAVMLLAVEAGAAPALRYRTDRILIQVRPAVAAAREQFFRGEGLSVRRDYPRLGGIQVLNVPPGRDVVRLLARLRASGLVEVADLDNIVHVAATPDDPALTGGLQWGLYNNGSSGGVPRADIHALEAWDTLVSATNTIVAVVDSGVRYTHQDLASNLWVNPGETPGNNRDDDHNGIKDDVFGINALGLLSTGDPWDDFGHGTAVAGVIGALGNNGAGISGVAWRARVMACKFLDSAGNGAYSDAVECLSYARDNGARIINASFIDTASNAVLYTALQVCRNAGIIVVAAAGNVQTDNDVTPYYPASFNLDNIVSVAASTRRDTLASFSNFGAASVDLAAPGQDIYLLGITSDSAYVWNSGTSFAAPHVAGALALTWARFPTNSYRQIIDRLLAATDRLPAFAGKCVSGGRLNLARLLAGWSSKLDLVPGGATNGLALRLSGEPWVSYVLESSFAFTNWIPAATKTTGADGVTTFTTTNNLPANDRFYRARRQD